MEEAKLISLVGLLNQTEKKDRNAIIAKAAEENGLKFKDAMKLLEEAGYDPKADPRLDPPCSAQPGPTDPPPNSLDSKQPGPTDPSPNPPDRAEGKKTAVMLRHMTEFPGYRCAGLVLTQKATAHEVTDEQLAKLKKDPWVVIVDDNKDGK